jgi:hypothetical protein
MRRLVIAAVAAFAVAALAAGTLVIGRTAPADDEHAALAAHRAFLANLAKGDRKAVGAASGVSPGPMPRERPFPGARPSRRSPHSRPPISATATCGPISTDAC